MVSAGASGLSLINTLLGMAIDVETGCAKLANVVGGLSGPAIRPIAVRAIWQVHQALPQVPIIGMGGVSTVQDAIELILAGASAVAVGTANFVNPFAAHDLVSDLADWCSERGIASIAQLRGVVRLEAPQAQ